jgi:hypothetical protein
MDNGLNKVLDGFVGSYMERDKTEDFSGWLSKRLQQEMPDMPGDAIEKLSGEIIDGVARYDETLAGVNAAFEDGESKEEWLAGYVADAYEDMPFDEAGEKLQRVYSDMVTSNAALMGESAEMVTAESIEAGEWNEYSLKDKALNIGTQAVMTGLGVAANAIKLNMENGGAVNSEVIGLAFREGAEVATGEVKAVVAGAIKVAAENKLTDALPEDTPVGTICDIAGVAVEGAEAMFDVATGKSTVADALDRTGRASAAAVGRWCSDTLKGFVLTIPYVGPIVANLAEGLFEHMKTPRFAENVYTVVRDATVATWEGIKQKARGFLNFFTNKAENRAVERLNS